MFAFLNIRCGYPCSHVLKVTNEPTLDMNGNCMPPTTICEFIYYMNSTKVDYHVRKIYMNSMNLLIHVLIEFTCL